MHTLSNLSFSTPNLKIFLLQLQRNPILKFVNAIHDWGALTKCIPYQTCLSQLQTCRQSLSWHPPGTGAVLSYPCCRSQVQRNR